MTGIAKFYNKFLSFIELDPTRPDPTRGSTRPACNSGPQYVPLFSGHLQAIYRLRMSMAIVV